MNNTDAIDTDCTLVRGCQMGDVAAFNKLVTIHRPRIVSHAMRMLNDHHAAESAAQEVLLRLYTSMDSFREDARFTTWLYRVTENVCLTRLGKEHRECAKLHAFGAEHIDEVYVEAFSSTPEFAAIIDSINPDDQQILMMRFVCEWELSEIAAAMNLGISATKMRLYRALEKLRSCLADDLLHAA